MCIHAQQRTACGKTGPALEERLVWILAALLFRQNRRPPFLNCPMRAASPDKFFPRLYAVEPQQLCIANLSVCDAGLL